MRLASLVCSSVRPCVIIRWPLPFFLGRRMRVENTCLHDDLLRAQTTIRLHLKVEFLRFPVVVEGLIVAWGLFFRCVCTQGPFFFDVGFVPVCGVS